MGWDWTLILCYFRPAAFVMSGLEGLIWELNDLDTNKGTLQTGGLPLYIQYIKTRHVCVCVCVQS